MDSFCGIAIKTDIYNGVHIDLSAFETASSYGTTSEQLTLDQFVGQLKGIVKVLICLTI